MARRSIQPRGVNVWHRKSTPGCRHTFAHRMLFGYWNEGRGCSIALHEVSMVVMQKFRLLDCESGFLPWAREIARREALNFQKRKARRPGLLDPATVDLQGAALDGLEARTDWDARHEALTSCLDQLPERCHKLIRMRYNDAIPNVESLALFVGRTMSATYALLKRIHDTLRKCVEKNLAGGAP